jgi:glycosyltransferase involved in cell wall biosynthesis
MMLQRRLRVLQITASDRGGAGFACIRLHRALRDLNVDSRVFVGKRNGTDEGVVQTDSRWQSAVRFRLDRLPLQLYRHRQVFAWWSVNWLRSGPKLMLGDWEPDVVHAHWIGDGFAAVEWLGAIQKPVIWTMHDMWPFTGGCHYARNCMRYETGCGVCPQLGSRRGRDLSSRSLERKRKDWAGMRAVAVSPSHWLAETASRSAILRAGRVEVIPNGLDGRLFKPGSRAEARRQLGLPDDERILLTGAVEAVKDERKGFALLAKALSICRTSGGTEKWRLLIFGADSGPGEDTLGIPVSYFGNVDAESNLPRIYQAADVYTLPSLQDNLPNTVVEAMACGKPVVGFRVAGLATMIHDGITGWLADPFSTDNLAAALRIALETTATQEWSTACREEFERLYAWPGPAEQYLRLYGEMLETDGKLPRGTGYRPFSL